MERKGCYTQGRDTLSAIVGVWNDGKQAMESCDREPSLLGSAMALAYMVLENHGISYEGEVSIETAVLKGRDLYLGFWVDGKHYARILRDAFGGEQ